MSELLSRSRLFALRCLRVADSMPTKAGSRVIASQLARRGRSKAEFLSKLQIALEEADESHFWLGLAIDGGYLAAKQLDPLVSEADELTAMLVSSLKTARRGAK